MKKFLKTHGLTIAFFLFLATVWIVTILSDLTAFERVMGYTIMLILLFVFRIERILDSIRTLLQLEFTIRAIKRTSEATSASVESMNELNEAIERFQASMTDDGKEKK